MEEWVQKLLLFLGILYLVLLFYLLWAGCAVSYDCTPKNLFTFRALIGVIVAGLPAWVLFLIFIFSSNKKKPKKKR